MTKSVINIKIYAVVGGIWGFAGLLYFFKNHPLIAILTWAIVILNLFFLTKTVASLIAHMSYTSTSTKNTIVLWGTLKVLSLVALCSVFYYFKQYGPQLIFGVTTMFLVPFVGGLVDRA